MLVRGVADGEQVPVRRLVHQLVLLHRENKRTEKSSGGIQDYRERNYTENVPRLRINKRNREREDSKDRGRQRRETGTLKD